MGDVVLRVCACVEVNVDLVRKQSNEAARQRLSKLDGEKAPVAPLSFIPVLQGKMTIKQGSFRSSECWRVPLISCLDDPLQASPCTGQQWLGGDGGGGVWQTGSGKFHLGFSVPFHDG